MRNPVFYSTTNNYKAYSEPKKASFYTRALLDSLQHFGAEDLDGPWRVDSQRLMAAIEHLMSRQQFDRLPPPTVSNASNVRLNWLDSVPDSLVYVKTEPPGAVFKITLDCTRDGMPVAPVHVKDSSKGERVFRLPAGNYQYAAKFPSKRTTALKPDYVRPYMRTWSLKEP